MEPARFFKRWRKRLRAITRTESVDRELDEELAFHLEMATQQNMRDGMNPDEARRQAKLAFGTMPRHRAETREARWLSWFPDLSLDIRLGARMLAKYPGITFIGGFAMAFAIWVGCVTFEMVNLLLNPTLPLPNSASIVQIATLDAEANKVEHKVLHEFVAWRQSLRSVTELGAYRDRTVNLIAQPGNAHPVPVAEITATAFSIAPEPPLLGRTLIAEDERAGAPHVVVLGHDIWRSHFGGAPDIIGKTVQLDEVFATIVGVMPEGYEFPSAHDVWIPFRADLFDRAPRSGPEVKVFGRLAPGVSLEEAQTEMTAFGARMAAEFPVTHKNLQPRVLGYTADPTPGPELLMQYGIPGFAVMLLVLVCSNVALLMFARAATRESELIVRSALGASRPRIVIQLFTEALVLGGIAAAIGLAATDFALRQWGTAFLEANYGRLPFWIDVRLTPTTVLYAIGLTILAAAIAGVVPALKATSGMFSRLRQVTAGSGGLKFGGVWTAVIIVQIAFTTAFPAMLLIEQRFLSRVNSFDAGFPAEQYLAAMITPESVIMGNDSASIQARQVVSNRFLPSLERLRQQLLAKPEVLGVTFVDRLPRDNHRQRFIELDEDVTPATGTSTGAAPTAASDAPDPFRIVHLAYTDDSYFRTLQTSVLAGRDFQTVDVSSNLHAVIVDQGFIDQVLDGRNPIGRRFRFVDRWALARGEVVQPEPWLEIVGAVKELGMGSPAERGRAAGVYIPTAPGFQGPVNVMVHVRGDPLAFIPQLRAAATEVDPTMRLAEFKRVDQVVDVLGWVLRLWLKLTGMLTLIALVLSLAGIYAVMSFTVSKRTREIGIRVALGASARRIVASIFRRPLIQVAIGVAAGTVLAGFFVVYTASCQDGVCRNSGIVTVPNAMLLLAYAGLVFAVCMLACVVPTRRALAVEPTEALRAE